MRKRITALLLALLLCFSLVGCTGGSSGSGSHSSDKATCGSCGRSYEAGDSGGNYMSIAKTHMCKKCYNNYKTMQAALGN